MKTVLNKVKDGYLKLIIHFKWTTPATRKRKVELKK